MQLFFTYTYVLHIFDLTVDIIIDLTEITFHMDSIGQQQNNYHEVTVLIPFCLLRGEAEDIGYYIVIIL